DGCPADLTSAALGVSLAGLRLCSVGSTAARRSAASDRHGGVMADSTAWGPTSRKVVTPSVSSVRMPSRNRTDWRMWRTQYSGEHSSSVVARSPVTLETIGIRGGWKLSRLAMRRNSAIIGSIFGEWNAWLTL